MVKKDEEKLTSAVKAAYDAVDLQAVNLQSEGNHVHPHKVASIKGFIRDVFVESLQKGSVLPIGDYFNELHLRGHDIPTKKCLSAGLRIGFEKLGLSIPS